ncbi:hypothetical protein [Actinomadura atramentaria]|uniref:hypothetical protein n=1 Tax=Actinomadura atramentaria TaxID=1990 RepID=UPI000368A255|nr:hypothetical protein [Actinomadura atramentaria]
MGGLKMDVQHWRNDPIPYYSEPNAKASEVWWFETSQPGRSDEFRAIWTPADGTMELIRRVQTQTQRDDGTWQRNDGGFQTEVTQQHVTTSEQAWKLMCSWRAEALAKAEATVRTDGRWWGWDWRDGERVSVELIEDRDTDRQGTRYPATVIERCRLVNRGFVYNSSNWVVEIDKDRWPDHAHLDLGSVGDYRRVYHGSSLRLIPLWVAFVAINPTFGLGARMEQMIFVPLDGLLTRQQVVAEIRKRIDKSLYAYKIHEVRGPFNEPGELWMSLGHKPKYRDAVPIPKPMEEK